MINQPAFAQPSPCCCLLLGGRCPPLYSSPIFDRNSQSGDGSEAARAGAATSATPPRLALKRTEQILPQSAQIAAPTGPAASQGQDGERGAGPPLDSEPTEHFLLPGIAGTRALTVPGGVPGRVQGPRARQRAGSSRTAAAPPPPADISSELGPASRSGPGPAGVGRGGALLVFAPCPRGAATGLPHGHGQEPTPRHPPTHAPTHHRGAGSRCPPGGGLGGCSGTPGGGGSTGRDLLQQPRGFVCGCREGWG